MNICLILQNNKPNPKGSNAYNDDGLVGHTTPSGSHIFYVYVGYKHTIPSGLIKIIEEI